jgi:SAM-dependent methyltransferase
MDHFLDLLEAAPGSERWDDLPLPEPDAELDDFLTAVPVLDAGCGSGRDSRELAARGLPVLAVDLSQGMLDEARAWTARRLAAGAIHYALMDLRRLELPDACCRGVWCSASLLHLPRPVAPRAVAELARVARPGAPLVVFLKLAGDGPEQRFLPYAHDHLPGARRFFAYYAPDEAQRLVEGAGFRVRDIATSAEPPPPDAPGWVAVVATRP